MTKYTAKEYRQIEMVQDMKESLLKEIDMVKVSMSGLMEQNLVVTG
jgi:hypothetical protein